jgi:hypothetical protein
VHRCLDMEQREAGLESAGGVSSCAPCWLPTSAPQKEAQQVIASSDCPTYLQRAESRLEEESERCRAYLDPRCRGGGGAVAGRRAGRGCVRGVLR